MSGLLPHHYEVKIWYSFHLLANIFYNTLITQIWNAVKLSHLFSDSQVSWLEGSLKFLLQWSLFLFHLLGNIRIFWLSTPHTPPHTSGFEDSAESYPRVTRRVWDAIQTLPLSFDRLGSDSESTRLNRPRPDTNRVDSTDSIESTRTVHPWVHFRRVKREKKEEKGRQKGSYLSFLLPLFAWPS